MDPDRRRELIRYGAPVLFLAAVTVAVLLIKSGLDSGSSSQADTSTISTTTASTATQTSTTTTKLVLTPSPATTTTATTTTTTVTTTPGAQYYVIQTGDTLGAIAAKYSTSIDQLLTWNPGLQPSALQPGARIRVG